ncbi:S9 family peptidase [Pedobacter heparinus]|uniref:Peptidase S9B dipeptidylpeptidase IV domain protein n=1 Tax=Pedobacter heparinus (strain ATCC 13125 / DSM 2366 / CIP 104194 / JCM 7457 / NBRC 12017 / NCIMB 9290 / NRRL B-14731 / HIM 762-3) TaxID=485917 RepID=C6Y041_PEDHD|nr:S9 family peptidase [Pedobacter heparinus]ACU04753.1 peptidase S9B dipeptidylpeptidase IV domain protein [Pedobacter heparinus DSM 2366]
MNFRNIVFKLALALLIGFCSKTHAQNRPELKWTKDGNAYYQFTDGELVSISLAQNERKTIISRDLLYTSGQHTIGRIKDFFFSEDGSKVLIYTNSKKVWRYETRGDYFVADLKANTITQVGKDKPASSLMFAKFSPDGNKVAYVSKHNLYVDDLMAKSTKALTTDGTERLINGTFDWVYEEEFDCRDGFRWSPDGQSIAYWQIDATKIKNFLMIDNTDSIYPFTIPVEYPKVGEDPSSCKVGVVNIASAQTKWLNIPGDAIQNYIPRMGWIPGSNEVILQQLNREQNVSKLFVANAATGVAQNILTETDQAWIDAADENWEWVNENKEFIWMSEKDGWRHAYRISKDGKRQTLITKGDFDVIEKSLVDEKNNSLYYMASPGNATQKYLYKTKLSGGSKPEMVTPSILPGTHNYDISPNGIYARHTYTTASVPLITEWMKLTTLNPLTMDGSITNQLGRIRPPKNKVEFFKVTTEDGIELDGWMKKPDNFDQTKKYPVVFYVYGEPASQTVKDEFGTGINRLYAGDMPKDGYIYISVENRGAPAPKGREWRKSIYKNIGLLNIRDQAMAAKKILQWPFVDKDRVAVWGWSGGGSSTLNLMFQYPEIYKTGIAIAAVANQLTYDNIYQERYMGSPLKTKEAYIKGSPVTYAKNLQGNLLYIHGTGDDNVHYQNAEMLINELIRNKKVFQLMSYPNRTHSINEGENTSAHLALTYTEFLRRNCPPGGR